jgi:antitoxin ParD1/3/4
MIIIAVAATRCLAALSLEYNDPMSINLQPELQAKLRERAGEAGITIEAYVERLVRADEAAMNEVEELALEGLNSGEPIEADNDEYWKEKRRRLDQHVRKTSLA